MKIKALFRTSSNGHITDVLVEFPITAQELIAKFEGVAHNLHPCARYMFRIEAWEAPNCVKNELANWEFDLEEINTIARHLESINEDELPILSALLSKNYTLEEACETVAAKDYDDLRDKCEEDIVRAYLTDNHDVPDFILDNVNWNRAEDTFFNDMDDYVYVRGKNQDETGWVRITR